MFNELFILLNFLAFAFAYEDEDEINRNHNRQHPFFEQSLNRDGYGRPNPNQLLNGFYPVWAIFLLIASGKLNHYSNQIK
jgi:hypothetical protein